MQRERERERLVKWDAFIYLSLRFFLLVLNFLCGSKLSIIFFNVINYCGPSCLTRKMHNSICKTLFCQSYARIFFCVLIIICNCALLEYIISSLPCSIFLFVSNFEKKILVFEVGGNSIWFFSKFPSLVICSHWEEKKNEANMCMF